MEKEEFKADTTFKCGYWQAIHKAYPGNFLWNYDRGRGDCDDKSTDVFPVEIDGELVLYV